MAVEQTREERDKERNKDRLEDDGMMTHMMLMAASMAGGKTAPDADTYAVQAVDLLKKRFT